MSFVIRWTNHCFLEGVSFYVRVSNENALPELELLGELLESPLNDHTRDASSDHSKGHKKVAKLPNLPKIQQYEIPVFR